MAHSVATSSLAHTTPTYMISACKVYLFASLNFIIDTRDQDLRNVDADVLATRKQFA